MYISEETKVAIIYVSKVKNNSLIVSSKQFANKRNFMQFADLLSDIFVLLPGLVSATTNDRLFLDLTVFQVLKPKRTQNTKV